MSKLGKIINVNDTLYELLGQQKVSETENDGLEVWKKRWGADTVLRNNNIYFFCRDVINAEFEDIK